MINLWNVLEELCRNEVATLYFGHFAFSVVGRLEAIVIVRSAPDWPCPGTCKC